MYIRGVAVMPLNVGESAEPWPTPTWGQMKDGEEVFPKEKDEEQGRK